MHNGYSHLSFASFGRISAISSKSDAHRALICAALSDAPTELSLNGSSIDIETTIRCLQSLGAAFDVSENSIRVRPIGRAAQAATLDCAESGSTLRFLRPLPRRWAVRPILSARAGYPSARFPR